MLDLKRHQFSAQDHSLRLDPGSTKNGEGRLVRLTPALQAMLLAQVEQVRALEREEERVIPWLFPHLDGAHAGQRIWTRGRPGRRRAPPPGIPAC